MRPLEVKRGVIAKYFLVKAELKFQISVGSVHTKETMYINWNKTF